MLCSFNQHGLITEHTLSSSHPGEPHYLHWVPRLTVPCSKAAVVQCRCNLPQGSAVGLQALNSWQHVNVGFPFVGAVSNCRRCHRFLLGVDNIHISFEEAMRLHLGIGQALAKLNAYDRSTKAGRRSALNLCLYLQKQRITINEGTVSDQVVAPEAEAEAEAPQ